MSFSQEPYSAELDVAGQADLPLKHSGFGIASFIIGLMVSVLEFALVVTAGVMEASTPGGLDERSPVAVLLGLLIIGGIMVCLFGAALGIGGLFQRDRKKVFAILGIAINAAVLLGVVALMAIGLSMQQ